MRCLMDNANMNVHEVENSGWRQLLASKEVKVFLAALCFRLVVYVIYFLIAILENDGHSAMNWDTYFHIWERWDANHYINIATNDYAGCVEDGEHLLLVFLPLYPWLMKVFQFVLHNYDLAGLTVSTLSFVVGAVFFYKLTTQEYSEKVAECSLVGLAIFPFGFFHGAIMTESLFFALLASFMYYLRRHAWMEVTIIGVFACLTKLQGAFLCFAILVELICSSHLFELIRKKDVKKIWNDFLLPGLKCVPMLFGIAIYLLINYLVEGDPFKFMEYQESNWMHTMGPIWNTVKYMFAYVFGDWDNHTKLVMWWPELILFFVTLFAIIYAIVKKMRPSFITIMISLFLVTYSSTWLISGGRYVMSILPLFMVEGMVLENRTVLRKCIFSFSFAVMILYMVAYYKMYQIM